MGQNKELARVLNFCSATWLLSISIAFLLWLGFEDIYNTFMLGQEDFEGSSWTNQKYNWFWRSLVIKCCFIANSFKLFWQDADLSKDSWFLFVVVGVRRIQTMGYLQRGYLRTCPSYSAGPEQPLWSSNLSTAGSTGSLQTGAPLTLTIRWGGNM